MSWFKILTVIFFSLLLFPVLLFAQGQVFWQENGVCVCSARAGGARGSSSELSIVRSNLEAVILTYSYHEGDYYWVHAQRINDQGNFLWPQNGVAISDSNSVLMAFCAVEDCKGGEIITWTHNYIGQYADQISTQRVDTNGTFLWGPNGIFVTGSQIPVLLYLASVSDSRGGVIVGWVVTYGFYDSTKLFVQRIDSLGNLCWSQNGILLTDNLPLTIMYSGMISDGKGGAIIVWVDARNGLNNYDIYAQRVDSSGVVQWQPGGVVVCNASDMQSYYRCTRGINSTIIVWHDNRHNGDADVYAQRLSDDGVNLWRNNGIPICALPGYNGAHIAVVEDSFGGAIIAWNDNRLGNNDVYVQKIDSAGNQLWTPNGIYIGTAISGVPQDPKITGVSDNRNGAIISWQDYRSQNWDIYCQRIQSDGIIVWQDSGLAVCTDTSDQHWGLEIISDNCGGAIIIWRDRRPGYPRTSNYTQRVGDVVGFEKADNTITSDCRLQITPNPVKGVMRIRVQSSEKIIKIYDTSGRLTKEIATPSEFASQSSGTRSALRNDEVIEISLKGMNPGIYFLRLGKETKKFIVTK